MCISFTTFVQFNLKVSVQQRMLSTMNMFNCYTYEKTYKSVKKKKHKNLLKRNYGIHGISREKILFEII